MYVELQLETAAAPMLLNRTNWDDWYAQIKSHCTEHRIWCYVSPDSDEILPTDAHGPKPRPSDVNATATSYSDLTLGQRDRLELLQSVWDYDYQDYKELNRALEDFWTFLRKAIPSKSHPITFNTTHREALIELRNRFKPSEAALRHKHNNKLRQLQSGKRIKDSRIDAWLLQWELLYNVTVLKEMSGFTDSQMAWDLLFAIESRTDDSWPLKHKRENGFKSSDHVSKK
ncbi:MAG: hypothetical protein M1820_001780 [Bogoriella megaspora]|nr:MAG: hypothetical protein M1820_001780 [Bogoriella megaspora]